MSNLLLPIIRILSIIIVPLLRYRIHLLNPSLVAIKWLRFLRFVVAVVNIIVVGELSLWWDIRRWRHWVLKVECDHIQRWGQADFVLYALWVLVGLFDYFVAAVLIFVIAIIIVVLDILRRHFHLPHFLPSSCYIQFSLPQEINI